ncbi:MAG: response regulator [Candidatus Portnoybacteria bacterium CG_4_8_14_3_um_filter_40_10]|uniref:Response regulator n=3 Tax=Candidatus Portnoyibacteriota TaxID=1817913 RepID=A0A2M7IJK3_9BACT|nr:MAG: response regulator [Candidatus Portnoybacteria bacterium CG11_big_fil_rev_8_21_14_0_20_40_15]PIW76685.1 MAG: response regulator [Candidatus Portnoybacteria bacterium CG_4_8_14_3_um_filter_40_10]PJA64243.1 MAG: response regulator [Candidatus Portnoybacteria bacterium CG_4_9_14_3_um_filter_40_10]
MPKILFVEDEPNHIAIYKTKLKQEGFDFLAAMTGEEAIPMIKVEKPDLILLDILLPGDQNGIDILAKLKKDPATQNIPIVVFTNYDEKEFREQASTLGANDFVLKSDVTPSQMVEKIRQILKQAAQ